MIYYTLEKNNDKWVVWKNVEKDRSCGSIGIYKSVSKLECKEYCKENDIKLSRRR
jgi:hypothetical protein